MPLQLNNKNLLSHDFYVEFECVLKELKKLRNFWRDKILWSILYLRSFFSRDGNIYCKDFFQFFSRFFHDHPRLSTISYDYARSSTIWYDIPRSPTIMHDLSRSSTINYFFLYFPQNLKKYSKKILLTIP